MKRSIFKVGLAVAAMSVSLLAPIDQANAMGDRSCPDNRVCVWDYRNFETWYLGVHSPKGTFTYRMPYVGHRLNDKIYSYSIGRSTRYYKYVMFYQDSYNGNAATGTGPAFYDKNGNSHPEMHRLAHPFGLSRGWEDTVSAFDEAS